MRRKRVLAIAVAMVVGACGARAQEAIRLSTSNSDMSALCVPSILALEGGAPYSWQDAKLKVTKIQLQPSQVPVEVHTGDVQLGDCAGVSVVLQAFNKGADDLVIVYAGAVKPIYVLMGSNKIRRLADLKGGRLAAPGPQSTAGEAITAMLQHGANLLGGRDYTLVSSGSGTARAAGLAAGVFDGTSSYPPISYKLADAGANLVADEADIVRRYVSGITIVKRSWAEQHRSTLVSLLKTDVQIGEWLKDPANKSAAIKTFAGASLAGPVKLGEAYGEKFYKDMVEDRRIAFDGYADAATFQGSIAIMLEQSSIKKNQVPPLRKFVDYSDLNDALRQLGLPAVPNTPE